MQQITRILACVLCLIAVITVIVSERDESHIKSMNNLNGIVAKLEETRNCTCVPYYQCSEDSGRVITDGDGLLDQRVLDETTCTGYFDVCCNGSMMPQFTPIPFRNQMTSLNPSAKSCGVLKKTTIPWSGVLLQGKKDLSRNTVWEYKCGVSIIHPHVALTAAHCRSHNVEGDFIEKYQVKVVDYESEVMKIIDHPQYHPGTLQNDLAVLILREPLENVGTICIPPPGSQLMSAQCTVPTWKKNEEKRRLRIIEVPLVQHSKCEKQLRKTRLGKYFQLHLSFICAGGNSFQDACDGDGGSPLICPVPEQPGRYHQVGIVSWGIGCGERDTPGVYVNVAVFRNWIDNIVQTELLDVVSGLKNGINSYRY